MNYPQAKSDSFNNYALDYAHYSHTQESIMFKEIHMIMLEQANIILDIVTEDVEKPNLGSSKDEGAGNKAMNRASSAVKSAASKVGPQGSTKLATKVVGGAKNAANAIKTFVKKIIEFIKNIFGRFTDFIQTAFQNNEKWLKERKNDFNSFNYTGLGIEMVPYWKGKAVATSDQLANVVESASAKFLRSNPKDNSLQEFIKDSTSVLNSYKNGDSVTDGIKNLMRVGNKAGSDAVQVRGNDLKARITGDFIPYLESASKTINDAKKAVNRYERYLKEVEKEASSRPVQETLLLTGDDLMFTDAVLLEGFQAVMEEAKDSTTGSTKVTKIDNENEQQAQNKAKMASHSDHELKVLRATTKAYSLVVTSTLTVLEEKYSAYFNAVKIVWKDANTRNGRKGNTAGQEKEEN